MRAFDAEAEAAAADAYKDAALGHDPYCGDDDSGGSGEPDDAGSRRSAYTERSGLSLGAPPVVPGVAEAYGMRQLAPAGDAFGAAGVGASAVTNAALPAPLPSSGRSSRTVLLQRRLYRPARRPRLSCTRFVPARHCTC
jgi:hypothetical protein